MSLKATPVPPVLVETVRAARGSFPKGAPWIALRGELGALHEDADFAAVFAAEGRPKLPGAWLW